MIKIGLTGSIGMGKTRTAALFEELGVPVYDADAEVHKLYARGGGAVAAIERLFPDAVARGRVDREKLARLVVDDAPALARLEEAVHPLVAAREAEFLKNQEAKDADMVVLDIPLLFEKERHGHVDVVVVVSAPSAVQRARVLEREGMTPEKLDALLARQTPDTDKCARADYIIKSDKGVAQARAQVKKIIDALRRRPA